ncbi:hypothetical protein IQ07DRAFT_642417 [Pyrenochaeta sp. DS3sAY3a]|nr:hypothetical protein IQ07DRAFT_642417 [Pyrenochaeta sp. DS3sAY3a]
MKQSPLAQNLFIVTPNTIILRSKGENRTLFECKSASGIVNSRASKDNSSLFAVADSQIVVLSDAARGRDKKYHLKSGQGEARLLHFSHDSKILYFTTTLCNSLQAYSVSAAELLPSMPAHPSPPDTLAISGDGAVLLSASPDPPTIYLQDTRGGGKAPIRFYPKDAQSPVSYAAFQGCYGTTHSSRMRFVLGFRDGGLGMYRLFLPALPNRQTASQAQEMQSFQLLPIRIDFINRLHKSAMGGITAAEFIPGYTGRIHVSGPATCLSISSRPRAKSREKEDSDVRFGGDATDDSGAVFERPETQIAIGTQTGKILVFNILGLLIHEISMDFAILNLEWVGDMSAPSILSTRKTSFSPDAVTALDLGSKHSESDTDEESGTVRKSPKPNLSMRMAASGRYIRDLFSRDTEVKEGFSQDPRISEVTYVSPSQKNIGEQQTRKKSSLRPRIATETFKSPIEHSSQTLIPSHARDHSSPLHPSIQDTHTAHSSRPPSQVRWFSTTRDSSPSSDDSVFLRNKFFTPPTMRRNKSKDIKRIASPLTTRTHTKKARRSSLPLGRISPKPLDTQSRVSSRTGSKPFNDPFTNIKQEANGSRSPFNRIRTARKSPPPLPSDTPSPLDSPASLYSRSQSLIANNAFRDLEGRQAKGGDKESAPIALQREVVGAAGSPSAALSTPSSVYSGPNSDMFRSHLRGLDGEVDRLMSKCPPLEQNSEPPSSPGTQTDALSTRWKQLAEEARREGTAISAEGIRELRQGIAATRKDIAALRREVRAMKEEMLRPRPKE